MNKILYHFSQYDFNIIKTGFFGKNSYSKNETKYNIKRFFCYDTNKPLEYHLQDYNFRYKISIPEKSIYNLDNDILNLKSKYDIYNILLYLKNNYTACFYTHSFKCYIVFKDIKPIEKIKRIKAYERLSKI